MKTYNSMLETIGNTPLIKLNNFTQEIEGNIFAKLEYITPGLSKKDRVALQMIEDAENEGKLKPGQPIVELTSGNMGTGLAIVCKLKGYRFIAVISKGNSTERVKMMKAFGAEVVLVDQMPDSVHGKVNGKDLELVEIEAQRITKELNGFRANQFVNPSTYLAAEIKISQELFEQLEEPIDAYVDFMGTGGSFIGLTKALKRRYPNIKCFGVESEQACFYAFPGNPGNGNHKLQGGGYSMKLPFLTEENLKFVDGFITIADEEAIQATRDLALKECIFAGFSSGANAAAAMKLLRGEFRGKNILILTPDSGTKYLSTDLWT